MTKFHVLNIVLQNSKDGRSSSSRVSLSHSGAGWGGARGDVDSRKGKEKREDKNRRFGAASMWAQRSQVIQEFRLL